MLGPESPHLALAKKVVPCKHLVGALARENDLHAALPHEL